ncbi:maleylpyruvate isomerase family mycothiol-dependent enzyme [Actinomadura alba]|uniref:Maleylpyruvate isomerase family mycothiol-dependent enzyme n=1 Tax=Actinomadura alba TaxID=406431 RepID=A0ABR7LKX8_9ACTN|nr:maleylpyruvate isomerase family mycothiol-dependent enzyme [Actinomadura alba]
MREGTGHFLAHLDALADADLAAPTALPGWSRGHLVAHVGYNARALGRLVHWARTGERTPMYASTFARDAEIAEGAGRPAPELRAFVRQTAEELWSALAGLSGDQWRAEVVTAQGRTVPATQIVWMRCREVWVHAVDLGDGATFGVFPPELVDRLLTDVTAAWTQRGQEPALILAPEDRRRTWSVELTDRPGSEVTGTAAALCAWITGRGAHGVRTADPGAPLPVPGRWL